MSVTALLDVNLLIALAWPNHIHHRSAHDWFARSSGNGWATCPLTQSAFVRVSSNRTVIPEARTPQESLEVLGRIIALPDHAFWQDDTSLPLSPHVERDRLRSHRQVTDAHLLALALRHHGRLATFDRGVLDLVPRGIDPAKTVELVRKAS